MAHDMRLPELPAEQAAELLQSKNVTPMLLTHAAPPGMLERGEEDTPIRVQVVCPGVVATEFHEVQGMDLGAVPRMRPEDVVTACLRGLDLGEAVTAPGVHDAALLDAVFAADLAAFGAQSPPLASRREDAGTA